METSQLKNNKTQSEREATVGSYRVADRCFKNVNQKRTSKSNHLSETCKILKNYLKLFKTIQTETFITVIQMQVDIKDNWVSVFLHACSCSGLSCSHDSLKLLHIQPIHTMWLNIHESLVDSGFNLYRTLLELSLLQIEKIVESGEDYFPWFIPLFVWFWLPESHESHDTSTCLHSSFWRTLLLGKTNWNCRLCTTARKYL